MASILPIPENLWGLHGFFQITIAIVGFFLTFLIYRKHQKKRNRVSMGLFFVFLCLSLAMLFASFDNLLGWENLGGEETWVGFGLAQIFNGLANTGFFWTYIEIFQAKERWDKKWKFYFGLFALIEIFVSILIMSYYTFKWPSFVLITSGIHVLLSSVCYIAWFVSSTLLLKRIQEPKYQKRFKSLRRTSISFMIAIVFLAISAMSETRSFTSWMGMVMIIIGIVFAYNSLIQPEE